MSRVYVAARATDADRAETLARRLRSDGHQVVSLWHAAPLRPEADLDRGARQQIARDCHDGVRISDALIALAHPDVRGTLVEIQAAYSYGQTVIVVGSPFDITLMVDRPGVVWARDEDEARGLLRRRQAG